ncbi:hypothetical protein DFH09DRAFT_1173454 [Mycena vulgaris]|nr:hypothetical protein DFH09DRAFT_1173454 [Mycena vulgaris]
METYETIYHNVANAAGLVPPKMTSLAEEECVFGPGLDGDIKGWKLFCRIRLDIERNWAGMGPSTMIMVSATGDRIFRSRIRISTPASRRCIGGSRSTTKWNYMALPEFPARAASISATCQSRVCTPSSSARPSSISRAPHTRQSVIGVRWNEAVLQSRARHAGPLAIGESRFQRRGSGCLRRLDTSAAVILRIV